jgi:hypothetical protein
MFTFPILDLEELTNRPEEAADAMPGTVPVPITFYRGLHNSDQGWSTAANIVNSLLLLLHCNHKICTV